MTRLQGVTWILLRSGHVLLEQCPKKARKLGVGEWFVPGGKIEGDESPAAACRREIAEEWPDVLITQLIPLPVIIEGTQVEGVFLMRPFLVRIHGDIPPCAANGVPLKFFPVQEALLSPVAQVRMMIAAAVHF